MKKHLKLSAIFSFVVFLLVAFGLRCFPLGCEWFAWKEILKSFIYVFIPVFAVSYAIQKYFHFRKNKNNLVVEFED